MYSGKPISKPSLLDPKIEQRIIRTLNPPVGDYWQPAKSGFGDFFQKYIKPNITIVIVICIIALFLIYRYHSVKKEKEMRHIASMYKSTIKAPVQKPIDVSELSNDDYANILLHLYNMQKDTAREPK